MTEQQMQKVYSDGEIAAQIAARLTKNKKVPHQVVPCPSGYMVVMDAPPEPAAAAPQIKTVTFNLSPMVQAMGTMADLIAGLPQTLANSAAEFGKAFADFGGGKTQVYQVEGEAVAVVFAKLMGESPQFFNVWVPAVVWEGAAYPAKIRYLSKKNVMDFTTYPSPANANEKWIVMMVKSDVLLKNKMFGLLHPDKAM